MTSTKSQLKSQVRTDAQGRLIVTTKTPSSGMKSFSPEMTGQELRDLLFPITPEAFTAEYWGRKPLFVKGSVEKLERLIPGGFTREDFFRAVRESDAQRSPNFKLEASYRQGIVSDANKTPSEFMRITPDLMEPMFAASANVAADYLKEPRLASLAVALKAQLQHAGTIDFFLTLSPAGHGFSPHIDRTSLIAVQLEGSKRYLISPAPVQSWPRGTAHFDANGEAHPYDYQMEEWDEIPPVDMNSLYEVVLEPGDILYMPSGTIHATTASTSYTLNLNLLFGHPHFNELLNQVLEEHFYHDPNWRHLPPISLSQVRAGELPAEAKEFFAARLAEVQAMLTNLSADAYAINQQWQKMIASPSESHLISLSLPTGSYADSETPVQPTDRLRLARRAPMTYACGTDSDGDPCVTLYCANREVSAAGEWAAFLQTLPQQTEFQAEAATRWSGTETPYSWPTVQEYLQALLEQGFLERAVV